jgi:hypothetical protein
MKRKAGALALLAALGGCVSAEKTGPQQQPGPSFGSVVRAREVAGVQGPLGEPVAMTAAKPKPPDAKKDSGVVQAGYTAPANKDSGIVQAGSVHVNKGATSGVVAPPPGAVAAVGALPGVPVGGPSAVGLPGHGHPAARTSVRFTTPSGMKIAWFAPSPLSPNGFTPSQVEVPGRYNFVQGGIYRLKLTDVPNRPALELYPTLEIRPANSRTATFLAHSSVPIGFTEEDFEQVAAGNFVVKVVYLPDPQFQDLAVAGPDEVVSTRLEPGVDPILEAQRRGSILAVIRMGNIDLEAPNTPPLNAPPSGGPFHGMPLQTAPGGVPPGALPPPGSTPPGAMPGRMLPPGSVGGYNPGAGRASVVSPAAPPTTALPYAPGAALPQSAGQPNVSVDAMMGRIR